MGLSGIFFGSLLAYTPIESTIGDKLDILFITPDSTETDSPDVELVYPFEDKSNHWPKHGRDIYIFP